MAWYLLCFAAGQASLLGIQYAILRNTRPPKHYYEPQDY